jgi:hypothetical protein
VILPGRTRVALLALASGLLIALPASANAAEPTAGAAGTGITVDVKGPKQVALLKKLEISGAVANPLPTDNVMLIVSASGRELFSKKVDPKADGSFSVPLIVNACCRYVVTAENGEKKATDTFSVRVPKGMPSKGPIAKLFNKSLQKQGFHTGNSSSRTNSGTRLAIKAFRKTNWMGRSEAYHPRIFRDLLQEKGAFEPRYTEGRHVEADLSRQVMSLIVGDRPVHTFHISSGTSATPTIRGSFRFYMRQAGYNNKRMYFSVYFRGGYATHGYNPVPNYPASHGCLRNPIQFSRFIYNWVDIGMPIHVYN